jgi:hypothetical protein
MKGIADWRHPWPAIEECYFRVAMQESKIVANYDGGWDALYFSFLYLPLFSSQTELGYGDGILTRLITTRGIVYGTTPPARSR